MLNSIVSAVNPAAGYQQWVIWIMHVPETLDLSSLTTTYCYEGFGIP
jgi:hypothetical protein